MDSVVAPAVESELLEDAAVLSPVPLPAPVDGSTGMLPVVGAPVLPPEVLPESPAAVVSSPHPVEAESARRTIVAGSRRIVLTYHAKSCRPPYGAGLGRLPTREKKM